MQENKLKIPNSPLAFSMLIISILFLTALIAYIILLQFYPTAVLLSVQKIVLIFCLVCCGLLFVFIFYSIFRYPKIRTK